MDVNTLFMRNIDQVEEGEYIPASAIKLIVKIIMENKKYWLRILFWITCLAFAVAGFFLSHCVVIYDNPEYLYFLLGTCVLVMLSIALGPGILAACMIGVVIGFLY